MAETKMKEIEQAITGYWGERCKDFDAGCPYCQAWAKFDALCSAAQPVQVVIDAIRKALVDARYVPGDYPVVPVKVAAFMKEVERILALPTPQPVERPREPVAATLAEQIVLTVKKLVAAEREHASLGGGESQPTNTSRDEADHWHAALTEFTASDCDAALKFIRRRATPPSPAQGTVERDTARRDREVLFFASYCGDDNTACSDLRPCPTCLGMSNVYRIPGSTEITYERQLSPDWLANKHLEKLTARQIGKAPRPKKRRAALYSQGSRSDG